MLYPPPRLRAWRVRLFSLPLALCLWLWRLVIFFDFGALGGPGFPASPSGLRPRHEPPPRTLQDALFFSSFFGCLFGSIFNRSWLGFPPQFASQNPPKSMKNRCQEALYVGLQICIDFFRIFTPNLDPRIPENRCFSFGK